MTSVLGQSRPVVRALLVASLLSSPSARAEAQASDAGASDAEASDAGGVEPEPPQDPAATEPSPVQVDVPAPVSVPEPAPDAELPSESAQALPSPAAPTYRDEEAASGPRLTASVTEGVRLSVPDAAGFTFELHLSAWGRLILDTPPAEEVQDYFAVPLVRPLLQMSLFDGMLQVLVQPELAGGTPRLLDLHLDFVADPAFRVRVGQFRTPYSRAFITPIVQLSMPTRGIVSDTFRAGRDTGLMVFGRVGSVFEYNAGVFNGSGIDGRIGDTPAPMVVARVAVTPYGPVPYDQAPSLAGDSPSGVSIGLGGFFRELDVSAAGDPRTTQQTVSGGADLSIVHGPFTFFSEGYFRGQRLDDAQWVGSWGAFAQASVFVVPRILEISARAGWIGLDIDADDSLVQSYEGGIKGYFFLDDVAYGHHLSLGLLYTFTDSPRAFGATVAGTAHRVTAQLQVWM